MNELIYSMRTAAIVVSLLLPALLCTSPLNASAGESVKDRMLAKAREQLIAKLKTTQPELAGYLEQIDAAKWGEYAGEIREGNARAVFEKILNEKKDAILADLYKKGKEQAISKGVLGDDTKTYIEWAETYGSDAMAMAEKAYNGDFRGAGDIVVKRMREQLQQQAKDYLSGVTADGIDFILKDLVGSSVGKAYLKILEIEMSKIAEFHQYTASYFGTFGVTLPDGKRVERNLCTQYAAMRARGHDPVFAFDGQDDQTGVPLAIADIVNLPGIFYSTTLSLGPLNLPWPRKAPGAYTRPDSATMSKELELCYVRSKVPDHSALQELIAKAREVTDRKLFEPIQQGMLERKQLIIIIISQTKIPGDFSLVVHVAAETTGTDISGSTVVMNGDKKDAPSGVAVYARPLTMLDEDKSGDSLDVTAEASDYDSRTESFTIGALATRFDADRAEVQVRLSLRPVQKASENVTIEVTVTDQKTGDRISGAKTTFDGDTRDAASGIASYTRESSMLDPAKSGDTVTLSAAGSGYKSGSDSFTVGELAAKLDKSMNRIALTISLEKASEEKAPENLTIDVTVTDRKTGDKIPGAKATFDGETRDAPTGVASYTRKSSMLTLAQSESNVILSAEASRYKSATASYTIGRLASELDKDKHKITLVISLAPEDDVDEIARFAVQCGPREIFEDEASICRAELTFKSGKTKGVSGEAKWTPGFVETSKGTVRGQEAKAVNPLPYTVTPEATYHASPQEGGKSWVASDTVLVKSVTSAAEAAIKIRKVPSASVVNAGDTVIYSITVTNMAKTQLDRIRIVDEKCDPVRYVRGGTNFSSGILDPNETWEFECRTVLHTTTQNTAVVEAWSVAQASLKVTDQATAMVTVQPKPTVTATLHVSVRDRVTRQEIPESRVVLTPDAGWKTKSENGFRFEAVPFGDYEVTAAADGYEGGLEHVVITQQQDYLVVIWLNKTPDKAPPTPQLIARLECGGLVEVVPGEISKSCYVMVEGWRSDTAEPVDVSFRARPPRFRFRRVTRRPMPRTCTTQASRRAPSISTSSSKASRHARAPPPGVRPSR